MELKIFVFFIISKFQTALCLRTPGLEESHNDINSEFNVDSMSKFCPMCLVSVTTFGTAHFKAVEYPILIRRTVLVKDKYFSQHDVQVLFEYSKKCQNSTPFFLTHRNLDICISKFYEENSNPHISQPHHCSKILKENFASNIRPWNHEIRVLLDPKICSTIESTHLSPKLRIPNFENAAKIWKHISEVEITWFTITLIITRMGEFEKNSCRERFLANVRNKIVGMAYKAIAREPTDVYIIAWNFKNTLSSFEIFPPCTANGIQTTFAHDKIRQRPHIMSKVNDYLLVQPNISCWNFYNSLIFIRGYSTRYMGVSPNHWELIKNPMRKKLPIDYYKFLIHTKLFELWTQIFAPNFLLRQGVRNKESSVCGITVVRLGELSKSYVSFNYQVSRIRFLACGDTTNLQSAYSSTVSAFDFTTWLLLLVVMCLLIPLTLVLLDSSQSTCPVHCINALVTVVKLALEQSTPFSMKQTQSFAQKFVSLTTLFAFFILVNEYNNGKIAEIVSPNLFVPFASFSQLVNANYAIFTELGITDGVSDRVHEYRNAVLYCDPFMETHAVHFCKIVYPNQFIKWVIMSQIISRFLDIYSCGEVKILDNDILSNSTLLEDSLAHVSQSTESFSENIGLVQKNVEKLQETASLSKSILCEKTAVVVSEPQIWKYEILLRMCGIHKISVGKEKLVESRLGLQWEGWLPPFLLRRVRGVENSGIVDWWNNMATVYLPKVRTRLELDTSEINAIKKEKAKKKLKENESNLLFIAKLLSLGGLVAVVSFCVEVLWQNFSSYAKKLLTTFANKAKRCCA